MSMPIAMVSWRTLRRRRDRESNDNTPPLIKHAPVEMQPPRAAFDRKTYRRN
jgi:hypothetical protein